MKKIILILVCFCCFVVSARAEVLRASLNRNQVPEGEVIMLTLLLEDAKMPVTPDLKPLEKDFNIYSVSNANQINIINGKRSDVLQWNIGLIANKTGEISIPPIKAGSVASRPLVVKIIPLEEIAKIEAYKNQERGGNRYALKTEISNKNPFVQQQIDYVVTLVDTGGLQGDAPVLLDGGNNDWMVEQVAEPLVETKTINGKTIREIKFRYALFPQKSGKLKLPQVKFNGFYLVQDKVAYDPFEELFGNSVAASGFAFADMFATRHPVTLYSKAEEIDVRPIAPENNGNWWLPAEKVELFAEWEPKNPVFVVGEAVNRIIYLKAVGVVKNQLPEVIFPKINGVKQYPEKQQAESRLDNGKIVSIKKATNVYIPNQAGRIILPEIKVPWFNVLTQKMETAILPKVSIMVKAPENQIEQEFENTVQNNTKVLEKVDAKEQKNNSWPEWIVYVVSGIAFILGIAFSFILLKLRGNKERDDKLLVRSAYALVIKKAKERDLKGLRDALVVWAKENSNSRILNLKDVAEFYSNTILATEIDKLIEVLYSPEAKVWNSQEFIAAFESVCRKNKIDKKKIAVLPELYE